jgi:hypothetical protein
MIQISRSVCKCGMWDDLRCIMWQRFLGFMGWHIAMYLHSLRKIGALSGILHGACMHA